MHGLATSRSSRFVRAVALSQSAIPGDNGEEAVRQAFHVLDRSTSRRARCVHSCSRQHSGIHAVDRPAIRKSQFFSTARNRRIVVDLMRAELNATEVVTIPLTIRKMSKPDAAESGECAIAANSALLSLGVTLRRAGLPALHFGRGSFFSRQFFDSDSARSDQVRRASDRFIGVFVLIASWKRLMVAFGRPIP
jgi:hypothetical protein